MDPADALTPSYDREIVLERSEHSISLLYKNSVLEYFPLLGLLKLIEIRIR
jgi:hypothetical protein